MTGKGKPLVDWSTDVSAADWIIERLHPFASDVGALVPEGFAAYARILHPAWRTEQGQRIKVRWADLAREKAVRVDPTTQFDDLAPGTDLVPPSVGTLERDELDALVEILADHTRRADSCWFGLWEGYGWMRGSPAVSEFTPRRRKGFGRARPRVIEPVAPPGPRVQIPERPLVLYRGPIEAATAFCQPPTWQSPNLWWPEDRAWCVASEIDLESSYLGGTESLVDQLLHDRRLEVVPVSLTDPIHR
ncbi:hypothetical protein TH66_15180 [Carbonactinospora thermoautotrophica]|uniref:Uncharacterized protein n=1 Tax=Carbonactinospora thermoautotrophica TaxID=1469144 RepID=A0A132N7M8_9ACTN|nr:hypothetical protein TH66_15180 [Carbonactinospora thermoautotrophica]KWX06124.1 hypothetical protein TR74_23020 [Carbonactinospora thermoautotrophica]